MDRGIPGKSVVLAAFSLYKPALCKQPAVHWRSRKDLMLSLFHESLLWMPLPGASWDPQWFCGVPGCSWAWHGGFGCLWVSFLASAAARGTGEELPLSWWGLLTLAAAAVLGVGKTRLLNPLFLTAGREGQTAFVNNFSNGKSKPGFPATNSPFLSVVWITAILLF